MKRVKYIKGMNHTIEQKSIIVREVGQGLGHNICMTLFVFSFIDKQVLELYCRFGFSVNELVYEEWIWMKK